MPWRSGVVGIFPCHTQTLDEDSRKKSWHLKGPRLEGPSTTVAARLCGARLVSYFFFFPFFSIFLKGSVPRRRRSLASHFNSHSPSLISAGRIFEALLGCVRPAGQVPVSFLVVNAAVRNNNTQQTEKLSASAGHVKDKNGESSHTQTHARSLPTPQSQVAND